MTALPKLYDLARVNSATLGTGTITLGSAVSGFLTFANAGVQDGETVTYGIADGANSEVGTGVYTASGTTLTRVVRRSTGAGNTGKITLSGSAQIYICPAAEDMPQALIGQFPGTATNDNASAGNVGEIMSSSLASGSAVALTTNSPVNIASITLTAGDWDVSGVINFKGTNTTTVDYAVGSISLTTGTLDATNLDRSASQSPQGSTYFKVIGNVSFGVGPTRISVNTGTTVFLVAQAGFAVSTAAAFGIIRARRVR